MYSFTLALRCIARSREFLRQVIGVISANAASYSLAALLLNITKSAYIVIHGATHRNVTYTIYIRAHSLNGFAYLASPLAHYKEALAFCNEVFFLARWADALKLKCCCRLRGARQKCWIKLIVLLSAPG